MSLSDTLNFLLYHPLTAERRLAACRRFVAWQLVSRLAPGAVAVPFVNGTRLLVNRGMAGATGNVYAGLHDFPEMSLVMHALRPGETFVDVGANVGSYTIAACSVGARAVAFEPAPVPFAQLGDNVRLNGFGDMVDVRPVPVGDRARTVSFTTTLDVCNHVLDADGPGERAIRVETVPLDRALDGRRASVMKIDVEGFEAAVLSGAPKTLQSDALHTVILELNGSGIRYGKDDRDVHQSMLDYGFNACDYRPLLRELTATGAGAISPSGNTIYVRDVDRVSALVRSAPSYTVLGRHI